MTTTRTRPSLVLPVSWRRRRDAGPGTVVAARAPRLPPSGIPPELVLHVTDGVGAELEDWRAAAVADLAVSLEGFAEEDDDLYELDGRLVLYHRFAHRLGTADVVCDQWSWVVDGNGVTLTGSAAREDYPDWCDLFEAAAASVDLGEP